MVWSRAPHAACFFWPERGLARKAPNSEGQGPDKGHDKKINIGDVIWTKTRGYYPRAMTEKFFHDWGVLRSGTNLPPGPREESRLATGTRKATWCGRRNAALRFLERRFILSPTPSCSATFPPPRPPKLCARSLIGGPHCAAESQETNVVVDFNARGIVCPRARQKLLIPRWRGFLLTRRTST